MVLSTGELGEPDYENDNCNYISHYHARSCRAGRPYSLSDRRTMLMDEDMDLGDYVDINNDTLEAEATGN